MTADPTRRVSAFRDDALGDDDTVALVARLRSGDVSGPELVQAAIDRARSVQATLGGLAHEGFDAAEANADQRRPGFFAGIPSVVKDNSDLAGQPTGNGSVAYTPKPAKRHGAFVRTFLRTGLVPIGKSALPEFGFNASTEGYSSQPVANPWDTAYSAGGSSGGSAALVASGVLPIAHANDGGGSIRIPAAACGLVGLKPSRGRFPLDPIGRAQPVGILYDGVVTRTVRDTAAFLREAERQSPTRHLPPIGDVRGAGRRRLRIGVVEQSLHGNVDQPTTDALRRTADLLANAGHSLREMALPVDEQFEDDFSLYWGMLGYVITHSGRRMIGGDFDPARLDNLTRGLEAMFDQQKSRLPGTVRRLRALRHTWARRCSDVDVVLSPTLAHLPPKLGYIAPTEPFETHFSRLRDYVTFTPLQNVTGDPAMSLPVGGATGALPIGVHAWAQRGDERTLLELAYELESLNPWPTLSTLPALQVDS